MQQRSEVFALLDDCDSTAERRSSRLYASFVHERSCHDAAQLDEICSSVQQDLRDGLHAVVVADYEFGRNLQLAQPGHAALRFLLFRECTLLSREEAEGWLAARDNGLADRPSVAGVANIESSVTRDAFEQAIASVQEALRGVARNLMRNHLHHCATKALRSGKKEETQAMYDELLELIYAHLR